MGVPIFPPKKRFKFIFFKNNDDIILHVVDFPFVPVTTMLL